MSPKDVVTATSNIGAAITHIHTYKYTYYIHILCARSTHIALTTSLTSQNKRQYTETVVANHINCDIPLPQIAALFEIGADYNLSLIHI